MTTGTAVRAPAPPETAEPTQARILDAAFACAARFGIERTTMADVAKQARLSRQSVYRYFPSKPHLLMALVLREEQALIGIVRGAMEPHAELRPAMEAAFTASLRALRAHPLLDRVMANEPQALLPYLTTEANPVLELSTKLMEQIVSERAPHVAPHIAHRYADACARVFTSYAITPPAEPIEEVAASLAELLCNGLSKESS